MLLKSTTHSLTPFLWHMILKYASSLRLHVSYMKETSENKLYTYVCVGVGIFTHIFLTLSD